MDDSLERFEGFPQVWTIPPGVPFLRALASKILEGGFPNPDTPVPSSDALASYTILVPTRRAARELADVFLDVSDGKALLLPKIRPLGDVDEDELMLSAGEAGSADNLSFPPAISPLQRQLLLSRLLLEWARAQPDGDLARALLPGPVQALTMAAGLGSLLDQLETEQVSATNLSDIIKEDFAQYWQEILSVLSVIQQELPAILEERGVLGPTERRNRLIDAEAARLLESQPASPVIAAGSTGSIPATARLLKTIAHLPAGAVVLPGLDLALDEESWADLDPQHPQIGLRNLLAEVGIERSQVKVLAGGNADGCTQSRAAFFSEVMRPSHTTHKWRGHLGEIEQSARRAIEGLGHIAAENRRDEALAIALIMRQTLEAPGKTAALITPDRNLGRQVSAELRRWGLNIDDSSGIPLARTTAGQFIDLLLETIVQFDPAALVSLAQHPFFRFGRAHGEFTRIINRLELCALRGLVAVRSYDALAHAVRERRSEVLEKPHWHGQFSQWSDEDWQDVEAAAEELAEAFAPFSSIIEADTAVPLQTLLGEFLQLAETIAADESGDSAVLWSGDAGEVLSVFFSSLIEAGVDAPAIAAGDFGGVIMSLMVAPVVRPRFGSHPRLKILGLLEARLISADVFILGGLNEDSWPRLPRSDPWLNRPMRADLGLEQPERRIGLAAHDFVQAACGGEVWITTSSGLEGAPSVPSRWLLRLQALLKACNITSLEEKGTEILARCTALDQSCTPVPVMRPLPRPPVELRPRKLSITEIEIWLRDPYSIFGRHILKLKPLEALDMPPGPRERGIIIHGILEEFFEHHQNLPVEDIAGALREIGGKWFSKYGDWPEVNAFWRLQFDAMSGDLALKEGELRASAAKSFIETSGRLEIEGTAGPFFLSGRADRIDVLSDGTARIIDYKTGTVPGVKEVLVGFAPQLLLEAAMLRAGVFDGAPELQTSALLYLRLPAGSPQVEQRPVKPEAGQTVNDVAEKILQQLEKRIADFDAEMMPYPSRRMPKNRNQIFPYDHLARHREWASSEGAGGDQ
ncbi:MAG: double-strand break repair protein AddB [Hyphomicrobiales bacterium]